MKNRNKRVLWILNHKTLMPYEVRVLIELGFEVFTPKVTPDPTGFRSGAVDFQYDSTLTIPASILDKLNKFNFYEHEWPDEIVSIVNRYFGTVYVIPFGRGLREVMRKFEGQIMLRAFGLDGSRTYAWLLEAMYGDYIFSEIAALGDRFWFAQGYEQISEVEPPLLADRAIYLPIGVPTSFWETEDAYTGNDKRILFVGPNCITDSYYSSVYKAFKRDFGHFPHIIIGAQDVPVNDPHCVGFVSNEELIRLYQECALIYYHSTELRHVHYSPIEGAINGMPVVYYANSLLGRMTPEITYGRCHSTEEAQKTVARILGGDGEYVRALRADQKSLSYKFSDEYCKTEWTRNLRDGGYHEALDRQGDQSLWWRELKRSALRPIFHGRSSMPMRDPLPFPSRDSLGTLIPDYADNATIFDGIDFTKDYYPWFIWNISGMSHGEPWGRWSTGPKIVITFKDPLPKMFNLVIEARAYGPNIGKPFTIKVGRMKKSITLTAGPDAREKVVLGFSARKPGNAISISIPHPEIPPNDKREIGLGLIHMKVEAVE